jgi:hypothetical protein
MNDFAEPAREIMDPEELERLVDGELHGAAYRDLLSRMDEALARGNGEPWRRCALAFLEAQALRGDLAVLVSKANCSETAGEALAAAAPGKRRGRWTGMTLACVASFAAAFVLAAVLKSFWSERVGTPLEVVRIRDNGASSEATPSHAASVQTSNLAQGAGDVASPPWEAAGNLTLAVHSGDEGNEQRVEIPLYYVADRDIADAWTISSAAPPALLEALENAGHRVTRRQQFWPLKLDDGRGVIVPIEQLVVAPATTDSYQ